MTDRRRKREAVACGVAYTLLEEMMQVLIISHIQRHLQQLGAVDVAWLAPSKVLSAQRSSTFSSFHLLLSILLSYTRSTAPYIPDNEKHIHERKGMNQTQAGREGADWWTGEKERKREEKRQRESHAGKR